jgi:hypothetical protein
MASNSKDLRDQLRVATEYIEKIGKPERHFNPVSYGSLTKVVVTTEIGHQQSPSAQNYWNSAYFDAALAEVVRKNFSNLSAQALELMADKFKAARIAEKDHLLAQLAEIEALESAA